MAPESMATMPDENLSRREFAGRMISGAVPIIVTAESVQAEDKKADDPKPVSPVDRLVELVLQQYPDQRLDAAALAEIREDLETQLVRSAALTRFPLANHDEPGFVVAAWRNDA
jgi:hypothetical protein